MGLERGHNLLIEFFNRLISPCVGSSMANLAVDDCHLDSKEIRNMHVKLVDCKANPICIS